MEAEDFSLFGLLGRSWELDAAIDDLAFDHGDGAVAFALADGSVAIARTKDQEPAAKRIRVSVEDGRSSILPRTKPLPPIAHFPVQGGKPVALTAYGKHGFVIGDAAGALTSLTPGGERTPFAKPLDGPITALTHAPETGDLACVTAGNRVALIRRGKAEPHILDHETPVRALAFSPDGEELAVACDNCVTLWATNEKPAKLRDLAPCSSPSQLAWSSDQIHLALGQEKGGVAVWQRDNETAITLPDYPAPVRSLAWSSDGDHLVTAGAFRIIAWPIKPMKTNGAQPQTLDTGKPSLAAVETVALHPQSRLTAAGYENGALTIAKIGKSDELLIKSEGQGAITSLAWSRNAGYVALGSAQGQAALIELPAQLFK
ncbi:MAG: WD40 repeat domain-containing protein [Geminicoccaceae bacterium]